MLTTTIEFATSGQVQPENHIAKAPISIANPRRQIWTSSLCQRRFRDQRRRARAALGSGAGSAAADAAWLRTVVPSIHCVRSFWNKTDLPASSIQTVALWGKFWFSMVHVPEVWHLGFSSCCDLHTVSGICCWAPCSPSGVTAGVLTDFRAQAAWGGLWEDGNVENSSCNTCKARAHKPRHAAHSHRKLELSFGCMQIRQKHRVSHHVLHKEAHGAFLNAHLSSKSRYINWPQVSCKSGRGPGLAPLQILCLLVVKTCDMLACCEYRVFRLAST